MGVKHELRAGWDALMRTYRGRDLAGSKAAADPEWEAEAQRWDRQFLAEMLALIEQAQADAGAFLDLFSAVMEAGGRVCVG